MILKKKIEDAAIDIIFNCAGVFGGNFEGNVKGN